MRESNDALCGSLIYLVYQRQREKSANSHDAIAGDGKSRMREKRITSARDETKMDICKNEVGKYAEATSPRARIRSADFPGAGKA